jgi:hypothetical protein
MIEELVNVMNEPDDKRSDDYYIPEDTFARARYRIMCPISTGKWMEVLKTYVYHGSTRVILWNSTHRMCCLR